MSLDSTLAELGSGMEWNPADAGPTGKCETPPALWINNVIPVMNGHPVGSAVA